MPITTTPKNLKGYKQTEIGVIPEDWDIHKINELASITTGSKNTQDKINDGFYPFFVRSQNMESIDTYSYDGEAVLTAGDGVGTGKVFHYINGKFDFHQRVYKISDFNKKLNGYYFFLYFSNNFYNRIMQMTAKSSVDSVRMEMIANMLIPLPPIAEQTAIAMALSDIDAHIAKSESLIEKKKSIKQGAMQELLTGKKRLPGFAFNLGAQKTCDIGMIPADWHIKKLGEVVEKFVNGGTPTTQNENYWAGHIPWITGADIINQKVSEIRRYITKEAVKNSSTNVVKKGTLLLVSRTGVGKLAIAPFDIAISQDFTGVYVNSEILHSEYLYRYFDFHSALLQNQNQGTSIKGITRETLSSIQIVFPSKTEQTAIATILSDIDTEIEKLESQLAKYQNIKLGMMQTLLTGKIRLI